MRQCAYCGMFVADNAVICPSCRESLVPTAAPRQHISSGVAGRAELRRGLMAILFAIFLHYFTRGHSPWPLPFELPSILDDLFIPLLFLAGLGLVLLGGYRRLRD